MCSERRYILMYICKLFKALTGRVRNIKKIHCRAKPCEVSIVNLDLGVTLILFISPLIPKTALGI